MSLHWQRVLGSGERIQQMHNHIQPNWARYSRLKIQSCTEPARGWKTRATPFVRSISLCLNYVRQHNFPLILNPTYAARRATRTRSHVELAHMRSHAVLGHTYVSAFATFQHKVNTLDACVHSLSHSLADSQQSVWILCCMSLSLSVFSRRTLVHCD